MNKKGFTMWEILVMAVVILIVGMVVLFAFNKIFSKEADTVDKQIGGINDKDGDDIINTFDKCCNTDRGKNVDVRGCASDGSEATKTEAQNKC